MITSQDAAKLTGRDVYGSSGDKIGTVGHIWGDPSGAPAWASVKTGLFGAKESMVPLADANLRRGRLMVPFNKSQVRDAPRIDGSTTEPLAANEFAQLYDYYGQDFHSGQAASGQAASGQASARSSGAAGGYTADDVVDDRSVADNRATADDIMTRSEERLTVGTERERIGVAHLRKYVVTEEQQMTVPVSHEEVRLVREPITGENWSAATQGLTESELDVELFAERAVINKETIPVERVRMVKETVTEQQTVRGEVRKEHIEAALPNEDKRELD
ncbi:uncharacterized protein (TIGR02271 family) [Asanoa ferruginea]|uniref:Uncharacterized protein (TIGR02271 family) n=1 Tax=Asanoa ferruginea TaxID=53367 RepID=A0A3D9ZP83_9ACTN|nr:PRC and DUF2382 domain-containing protein [Asanoa ferruginea]REF99065.1 uncharacterized protein (TIGR02271 family) [Asanoa ferruginea]GIF51371.1 photosystem reaction center subunit H [Asanoa ferruginea]